MGSGSRRDGVERLPPGNPEMSAAVRPLTIVFCCNTVFGVVNFRAGVIRTLVDLGHRIIVVAPTDASVQGLRLLGAEFVEWSIHPSANRPFAEIKAVLALYRIYRDVRPDVAFHFTIKPVIYGAFAARRSGIPFFSVITGLGYVFLNASWTSRLSRALYRVTLRNSREVWFLNTDDRAIFTTYGLLGGAKVRMLPGEGVDTVRFTKRFGVAQSASPFTFLMIARLLRDKGVHEYVEAARLVREIKPSVRFLLVGPADSANPSAIATDQVHGWMREGLIEYLGSVDDVRSLIDISTCVVLPSYREGAPRCLLEAASMERPIVATDVPGCRDVLVDNSTGLLCKPRNAKDLADTLLRIADMDLKSLEAMGGRGRAFVLRTFDEGLVVAEYLDVLDQFK